MSRPLRARLLVAAMTLTAISCTGQRFTYAPDGRRGYVITCGGIMNSWASCLTKAGQACGHGGYDTLQGNPEDRTMLIACK